MSDDTELLPGFSYARIEHETKQAPNVIAGGVGLAPCLWANVIALSTLSGLDLPSSRKSRISLII